MTVHFIGAGPGADAADAACRHADAGMGRGVDAFQQIGGNAENGQPLGRAEATSESFRSALAATGMRPDALAVPADRAGVITPFAEGSAPPARRRQGLRLRRRCRRRVPPC
jgi:hypothetical protein